MTWFPVTIRDVSMYSFFPLYMKDHHSSRETGVFNVIWFLVNVCPQSDLGRGGLGDSCGEAFREAGHPRAWNVLWFFPSMCLDFIFSPRHFVGRFIIFFPDRPRNLPLSPFLCCTNVLWPTRVLGRFYKGRNGFFSLCVLKTVIEKWLRLEQISLSA